MSKVALARGRVNYAGSRPALGTIGFRGGMEVTSPSRFTWGKGKMKWEVWITDYDKLRRFVQVYIGRETADGKQEVLSRDGHTKIVEPSTYDPDVGISLPNACLVPLAEALTQHLGGTLPSEGERKVLREWLEAERARVDALINGRS